MLTSVVIENFRRIESADIVFDDTDQIVVITGLNGAGKTTLLEAVTYGLLGHSRNGKRRLDSLVRRGAEIEGLKVEVGFTVGVDRYRVVRQRVGKTASAVLFGNDNQLVEGNDQVTNAICGLFGMDAQGFKLAVVAQQKELDALLRLGTPQRTKALARLLRLDAVSRARDDARNLFKIASATVDALPKVPDLVELRAQIARAEAELASAAAAEADCRAELATLDAQLAASAGTDASYHDASRRLAGTEATLAAVEAQLARLDAERNAVVVPDDLAPPAAPLADLESLSGDIERAIAQAEATAAVAANAQMTGRELDRVVARLSAVATELARIGTGSANVALLESCEAAQSGARDQLAQAQEKRQELLGDFRAAQQVADDARARVEAYATLGATCDACAQDIPHEHAERVRLQAEQHLADACALVEELLAGGSQAADAMKAAEAALTEAAAAVRSAEARMHEAASLEGERNELERRRDTYSAQLARVEVGDSDVDSLQAQRGQVALDIMLARAASDRAAERGRCQQRIAELELSGAEARVRVEDARAQVVAAAVDADLVESYNRRAEVGEMHRGELEFLTSLSAQTASVRERVVANKNELRFANELAGTRRAAAEKAATAANANRLLADVESTLSVAVRPALEGAVSDLLTKMSNGRFTSVKCSADYTFSVLDDGVYTSLSELSGGEQDLIALAIRLGVADVVADRHGGSAGFLILDEVFGSQDQGRRETIMEALRALRSNYGQILCISHVGGLEDQADRTLEVNVDESGVTSVV